MTKKIELSVETQDFIDYVQEIAERYLSQSEKDFILKAFKNMEDYVNINTVCSKAAPSFTHDYSLAPCTPAGYVVPCQQEECKMNYATTAVSVSAELDSTKDQRKFLRNSLYEAFSDKKHALKRKFGLVHDDAPDSFEEMLARIQAGKYVIDAKDAKRKTYAPLAYIVWRDPSVKEDQDGYDAAKAELRKAYDKAEEDIRILAPEAGLASLRAFKDISVQ